MERLVNVHPVLGGALDEGGLQLLRHVFAVSSGDLQTVGLFRRDERYNIGIILRIFCNIYLFLFKGAAKKLMSVSGVGWMERCEHMALLPYYGFQAFGNSVSIPQNTFFIENLICTQPQKSI